MLVITVVIKNNSFYILSKTLKYWKPDVDTNIGNRTWDTFSLEQYFVISPVFSWLAYNPGHNILRFFNTLPSFLFTASETKRDY